MMASGTKRKILFLITGLTALSLLVYLPVQAAAESDLQEFREMVIQRGNRQEKHQLLWEKNPEAIFHVRKGNDLEEFDPYAVEDYNFRSEDPVLRKAIDLGESSLETLEQLLTHKNEHIARTAATCISIIGGEKAREILMRAIKRDEQYKPFLLSCLATTGTGEDVSLLLKAVEEGIEETKGRRSVLSDGYAFNSLSLIRTREAEEALRSLAEIDQTEAEEVLRELEEAILSLDEMDQTKAEEYFRRLTEIDYSPYPGLARRVISRYETWKGTPPYRKDDMKSVLMNEGIFALDQDLQYYESCGDDEEPVTVHNIWSYENNQWVEQQIEKDLEGAKRVPSICFRSYVSKNGGAAIMDFSEYYGPLHGYGYRANLKKVGETWKLVFYNFVWIS